MKITFASGKGGTGKTLFSTSLAWRLRATGRSVAYVDADVEAPNGNLFLKAELGEAERFTVPVPKLTTETCAGTECSACQDACAFHAILPLPSSVMVFPELCHSCGACVTACPYDVLVEVPRELGSIFRGVSEGGIPVVIGEVDVGEARSTPLVEGVVEEEIDADVIIVDSPPGTSCAAMAAVRQSDHVILVTEPTPFGLHDLRLAVEMCRAFGKSPWVVINRSDLGDDGSLEAYLEQEHLPLLVALPFDRELAGAYAYGHLAVRGSVKLRRGTDAIIEALGL